MRLIAHAPARHGGASIRLSPLFAVLLALAGCASTHEQAQQAHVRGPQVAATEKVELEDDGLPPQVAPPVRPREAVDPAEPFSPNYGSQRPAPRQAAGSSREADAPPPLHRAAAWQLRTFAQPALARGVAAEDIATAMALHPVRIAAAEEDAIIAQAITAHEMRRP